MNLKMTTIQCFKSKACNLHFQLRNSFKISSYFKSREIKPEFCLILDFLCKLRQFEGK